MHGALPSVRPGSMRGLPCRQYCPQRGLRVLRCVWLQFGEGLCGGCGTPPPSSLPLPFSSMLQLFFPMVWTEMEPHCFCFVYTENFLLLEQMMCQSACVPAHTCIPCAGMCLRGVWHHSPNPISYKHLLFLLILFLFFFFTHLVPPTEQP